MIMVESSNKHEKIKAYIGWIESAYVTNMIANNPIKEVFI